MAQPWKHPKTGIYHFRRAVPYDLREIVGKWEEKRSLRTKDPREAKRLFTALLAEIETSWARLRSMGVDDLSNARTSAGESAQLKHLSEQEAHERAAWLYRNLLSRFLDGSAAATFWKTELIQWLWAKSADPTIFTAKPFGPDAFEDRQSLNLMEEWCFRHADETADLRDWVLDPDSRHRLATAMGAATQRACLALNAVRRGEIDPATLAGVPVPRRSATPSSIVPDAGTTEGSVSANFTFKRILAGWWQEAKAGGRKTSTYESYGNTLAGFAAFVKHDDVRRVTPEDVLAFKDFRLTTPSQKTGRIPSAKTVKDSDLSALKTVFGWAVMNRKMAMNPALGITLKVGKAAKLRPKGFTQVEAEAILSAANTYRSERESPRTAAAKRWVPWLCAFTGARVGELAQLRKRDVTQEQGYWIVRITPEAGTVKTNEARLVVLHQQLIELGFDEFVNGAEDGPLFLTTSDKGDVLGPLQGLKNRLAAFSRTVVSDPNVAPNHGWRHRFKTVGMEAGIDTRILDAIQGQAPKSVAETYGEVTLRTMAAAIAKLPAFAIEAVSCD